MWQMVRMGLSPLASRLGLCTVFYVGTHGEAHSTRFQSDRDESPIPPNGVERIDTGEVYQKRVSAVGSGAPPFQSGIPPINLAFVDACDTGQDSAMGEAFLHPFANHVDRAPWRGDSPGQ